MRPITDRREKQRGTVDAECAGRMSARSRGRRAGGPGAEARATGPAVKQTQTWGGGSVRASDSSATQDTGAGRSCTDRIQSFCASPVQRFCQRYSDGLQQARDPTRRDGRMLDAPSEFAALRDGALGAQIGKLTKTWLARRVSHEAGRHGSLTGRSSVSVAGARIPREETPRQPREALQPPRGRHATGRSPIV